MHKRFPSQTLSDDGECAINPSGSFLQILFGENEELSSQQYFTDPDILDTTISTRQDSETSTQKHTKAVKSKSRKKKKGTNDSNIVTYIADSSDEEGHKRGPNWKEHWITNLITLRGTMHDKFSCMKKQGVDNWSVLHTRLVASCPNFNRSSDACRKKWKKLYDDYKADYTVNGTSRPQKGSKSKYYDLIDGFIHDWANVFKHVHGSTNDEDPNCTQLDHRDEVSDSPTTLYSTPSRSHIE